MAHRLALVNEPLTACEANGGVEYALRQFPDTRIAKTDVEVAIFRQDLATLL